MKKNYFICALASLAMAVMFSSCTVTNVSKSVKQLETEGILLQNATITNLQVGDKSTATMTFKYSPFGKNPRRHTRKESKEIQLVIATLLEKAGADVLVEPRTCVKTTRKPFKLTSEVTVSGFAAKYSNFRQAQTSDIPMIKMNQLINGNDTQEEASSIKNIVIH